MSEAEQKELTALRGQDTKLRNALARLGFAVPADVADPVEMLTQVGYQLDYFRRENSFLRSERDNLIGQMRAAGMSPAARKPSGGNGVT